MAKADLALGRGEAELGDDFCAVEGISNAIETTLPCPSFDDKMIHDTIAQSCQLRDGIDLVLTLIILPLHSNVTKRLS